MPHPSPPIPTNVSVGGNSYTESTEEMVQVFRVAIDFTEDLNSVSSTYVDVFITTYNSSSKGSNALPWHLQALHSHTQT